MQSHLTIAREQGMKAGFNAYVRTLERSGLPAAKAKLDEIHSMSKRKAFAAYCADKGPDVLAKQPEPKQRRRTSRVQAESVAPVGLAAEIAQAKARLAELEAQAGVGLSHIFAKAEPKADSKVKTNLWRPWAVRKYGIPSKVGETFAYKGKRRTTTFRVVSVTTEGITTVRA